MKKFTVVEFEKFKLELEEFGKINEHFILSNFIKAEETSVSFDFTFREMIYSRVFKILYECSSDFLVTSIGSEINLHIFKHEESRIEP
jgi:hypothetical protein